MVKKINSKEFEAVKNDGVIVVDFNATWCNPCKMLAPILESVSEKIKDVKFYAIDTDQNTELAIKCGVSSIPAVMIFKNGEKVAENIGFVPEDAMMEFVKSNK